jgi:serine phosphatase RsbU (regulator of sigma subunit)
VNAEGMLDTRTGMLSWVNRGHPPPLVIRQGRWITELTCTPTPPMGIDMGVTPTLYRDQLEPGDRLLFYTDGIVDARSPDGELFGLDRFTDFIIRREADGLTAPETLRRLIHTVLEHQNSALQDDATVLLAEWCLGDRQRTCP